jgi:hypothetical protein
MITFKSNMEKIISVEKSFKNARIFLLSLFISFTFTQFSTSSNGVFEGGDWYFPWSKNDAFYQFTEIIDPFSRLSTIFGSYDAELFGWGINFLFFLSFIFFENDPAAFLQRFWIILFLNIGFLSFYKLSGFFIFDRRILKVAVGLLFVYNPITFDYIVFGWNNIVYFYLSLPAITLVFMKIIQIKDNSRFILNSLVFVSPIGLLLSGSSMFQILLLYVFISIIVYGKLNFSPYLFGLRLTFILFTTFSFHYWWIAVRLFYFPTNTVIALNESISSGPSEGLQSVFEIRNLMNLYNVTWNNSYYFYLPSDLKPFTYLLGFIFLFSLVSLCRLFGRREVLLLFVLSFTIISYASIKYFPSYQTDLIGFAFLGRDPNRGHLLIYFFVLTFLLVLFQSTSMLRSLWPKIIVKYLTPIFIFLSLVYSQPWINGYLEFDKPADQSSPALSLRPLSIPNDYDEVIKILEKEAISSFAVLSYPARDFILVNTIDIWKGSAPVSIHLQNPSRFFYSDKMTPSQKQDINLIRSLLNDYPAEQLVEYLKQIGVKIILVDTVQLLSDELARVKEVYLASPKFEKIYPLGNNESRFRIIKIKENNEIPVSQNVSNLNTRSNITRNFFESKEFTMRITGINKDSKLIELPFAYSKYWLIKTDDNSKIDYSSSLGGLIAVDFTSLYSTISSGSIDLKLSFRPSLLAYNLFMLTFITYLLTLTILIITQLRKVISVIKKS